MNIIQRNVQLITIYGRARRANDAITSVDQKSECL